MQGARKYIRTVFLILILFAFSLGCAASYPVEKRTGAASKKFAEPASAPVERPAPGAGTNRISNIRVSEQGDEIFVTISGAGPFKDYQFQRSGENQFVLNLNDISKDSPRPPLPAASARIRLDYRDARASKGLQLIGALSYALDRYYLTAIENGLVLRLSVAGQPVKAAVGAGSSKALPAAAGPAGRISPGKASPAPPAPAKSTAPVLAGPIPKLQLGASLTKSYAGKPISLDLLDADIKNVLRLIADITGTNMVIEPDVSGKVTLKVEQVPWDQVLDLILSMNNLGEERVGNVIRIATRAKLKQEWIEQEEALKARQQLMEAAKDFGDIATEYLAVNYAKPSDVAAKIKEIKSEKGKISVDERTSLLIYTDYQSRIQNAKILIARLDKPTPQVMIEARIVQLNKSASRDLGIKWNFFLQHTSDDGSFFTQDFEINHPVTGDLFGFTFGQLTGQTIWNVDLVLSALESAGEGRIVSAPRVLTLDNVKALIKQGTQIPYLVLSDQNVASTQLVDAVLELQVTPHITPDEKVRLEIRAKKDQPDFSTPVGIQSQVPIDTREVQTELLVDNGSVVVIGGIIENTESRSEEGTPGLSRVPILGRLFKKTQVSVEKTELLIFISPKIVDINTAAQN